MQKYRFDGARVIENSTKFVIKKCKKKDDAVMYVERLNAGAGFEGDTPRFFVYKKDQIKG